MPNFLHHLLLALPPAFAAHFFLLAERGRQKGRTFAPMRKRRRLFY